MKKVIGCYYQKPLDLKKGQDFEIVLDAKDLYDEKESILQSNQLILEEIAKKYNKSVSELHSFFVIREICNQ